MNGDTLNLFTDTGGGGGYLKLETVRRAGLPLEVLTVLRPDSVRTAVDTIWGARWLRFREGAVIPAPTMDSTGLMYVPTGRRAAPGPADRWQMEDGFLGTTWFQDRVWTLDYPAKEFTYHAANPPGVPAGAQVLRLGFRTDSLGRRLQHYPRIAVEVDGETLQLLFDTGATTILSDSALTALQDGRSPARATSFIARAVFDTWRTRHPEWRVIPRAEAFSGMEMIEVPRVALGRLEVGPVWFTVRNDVNYRNFSRSFDQPIVGALGGNALRAFRITLDYPRARAVFESADQKR